MSHFKIGSKKSSSRRLKTEMRRYARMQSKVMELVERYVALERGKKQACAIAKTSGTPDCLKAGCVLMCREYESELQELSQKIEQLTDQMNRMARGFSGQALEESKRRKMERRYLSGPAKKGTTKKR